MKLILVLSALCALALAHPSGDAPQSWELMTSPMENPRYQKLLQHLYRKANFENGLVRGGRIVGGSFATEGQFPHQVWGIFDDTWLCGGSIISANYILTAAHCIYQISFVDVYAGSIQRPNAPHSQRVTGANLIIHAQYNDNSLVNDVALMRTSAIPLNGNTIQIVALANDADAAANLVGLTGTTSGFGVYSDSVGGTSAQLRYVGSPIISNAQCAQTFGQYVTAGNVCKDGYQGRGSCGGDSGGPMLAFVNGRTVQVGVVSYGAAAGCELGYPSVYARVTYFYTWITGHTGPL